MWHLVTRFGGGLGGAQGSWRFPAALMICDSMEQHMAGEGPWPQGDIPGEVPACQGGWCWTLGWAGCPGQCHVCGGTSSDKDLHPQLSPLHRELFF